MYERIKKAEKVYDFLNNSEKFMNHKTNKKNLIFIYFQLKNHKIFNS